MPKDYGATWPALARDDEFSRALAALDAGSGFAGVALVGDSGVGKSTLARDLAAAAESRGDTVRFVLGTRTGRDLPLGAFSRAITVDAAPEPAAMLAAAHRVLAEQPNLVIVVDDAHLLDALSATLVHQLAAGGAARLIVTIGSGGPAPDAVTALIKDRWLLHQRISAFTREQTGRLAQAVLGDAVGSRFVDDLFRRTAGNALLLRGLLSSGRGDGSLVHTDDGWRLHGPLHPDHELSDLLTFRLRDLDPAERVVIEVMATAEVLDWQILHRICDADAVQRLEHRGLIQFFAGGPDPVVALHHPVFGEVATRLAGVVRTRQLNGLLAQACQQQPAAGGPPSQSTDVRAAIRVAQFMMRSDLPVDLDVVVGAAQSALALGFMDAAEDLARFAFQRGGGLSAAITLGEALRWQGRSAEAEAVLADLSPGEDPLLTARWGCLRAINLFDGCGEMAAARDVLAGLRDLLDCVSAAAMISATEVSFDFFSGDLAAAVDQGMALCAADVYPPATVAAAMPVSWALALSGRLADTRAVVRAGLRAAELGASGPQRFAIGLAEAMALVAAGELAAAAAIAEHYAEISADAGETHAMVSAVLGYIQLARGEVPAAAAALHEAVTELVNGFQPAGLVLAASWSAKAESLLGRREAATAALRHAERSYGPQTAAFLPDLELARAWVAATAGQTTAARDHAIAAAQVARRRGLHFVEMRALHTVVRFGDVAPAARLAELARLLPGPMSETIAAHARGAAEHDGAALDSAADRFAAIGALPMAADAAALAARAHGRAGDRAAQLVASARARTLAGPIELRSPALAVSAQPLPITDREREIAAMVAAGLSNRAIAERLGVSVRTIEGHLYRIFAKLDIGSREQLARLVD